MKALVIGGTGPTGPHVVNGLLERGYTVTVMHGGQHEAEYAEPVEHIHTDVHFRETFLAGLGTRTFDLTIASYGRLKMTGDLMVGHTDRLIASGGFFPAGPHDQRWGAMGPQFIASEDCYWDDDPETQPFGSKMAAAERSIFNHYQAGHYGTTYLRYPAMLYGPRQPGDRDWCIVRRILDGRRRIIVADGGLKLESRGYAANVAHAMLLAIDQPAISNGKVYNVGDERVFTIKHRIEVIAKALNAELELVGLPFRVARPAHAYSTGPDHQILDISKIKAELGYRDLVPSEQATALAAQWLVEHQPEPGGEIEQQINDPFDYAAEDAMIEAQTRGEDAVLAVPFRDYVWLHMYRHPKKPNEPWQPPETGHAFGKAFV